MNRKNICEICTLIMGQSPDSKSYNKDKNGIPFYQGSADFGEEHPTPTVWCTAPKKIARKGDILISNIDTEMNVNGEYLIPSLLLLKKKVDKIFGSQKVVSLSEDRPVANEMTCGDESGYLQYFLVAAQFRFYPLRYLPTL